MARLLGPGARTTNPRFTSRADMATRTLAGCRDAGKADSSMRSHLPASNRWKTYGGLGLCHRLNELHVSSTPAIYEFHSQHRKAPVTNRCRGVVHSKMCAVRAVAPSRASETATFFFKQSSLLRHGTARCQRPYALQRNTGAAVRLRRQRRHRAGRAARNAR